MQWCVNGIESKEADKNLLGSRPDVLPMRPNGPLARLAIDRTACVWTVSQVCPDALH
jgi:hypothetical protein